MRSLQLQNSVWLWLVTLVCMGLNVCRYDGQEIRFHLLGGISPEITTANEYMGDGPKRVSASVLYSVREKVWFPEKEDKPEEFSNNVHYFEFESSIRGPINWRLRNINKSIDTP